MSNERPSKLSTSGGELKSAPTYEYRQYLDIYCPPARKFELVQQGYRALRLTGRPSAWKAAKNIALASAEVEGGSDRG